MQRRGRGRHFGALYRAAAGQAPDQTDQGDRGPSPLRDMLASRRPSAIDAPLSPDTSPRPAAESAALATAVAGQQGAAAPSNASAAAPSIPPPPAAAHVPAPPPRAYPMPAPGAAAPVSGFWGGGGPDFVTVSQPGVPAATPAVAPAPPAAQPSRFAAAAQQYTDDMLNQGAMVDTSGWSMADFQAAAAATGNYMPADVQPGSMQANIWATSQVSTARHPVDPAVQAQRAAESNALRAARTAAMGQLVSGPMSTPVSNPAEVAARFDASGYTGAQALADGWGTGTGRAGWETLPGYSAPLNPQGLMGAPYAGQTPAQASAPSAPAAPAAPPPQSGDPYQPPGYTPGVAATPPAQPAGADPYAPPGYTPGVAAQPPAPTTAPPPQSPPPAAPPSSAVHPQATPPMRRYSSYFGGLNKAAGG